MPIQTATVQRVNSTSSISVSYLGSDKQAQSCTLLLANLVGPRNRGRDQIDSYFFFGKEWLRQKLIGRSVSFEVVREMPTGEAGERVCIAYVFIANTLVNEAVVRSGWAVVQERALAQYRKQHEADGVSQKKDDDVVVEFAAAEGASNAPASSISNEALSDGRKITSLKPAELDERIMKAFERAKAEKLVVHNSNSFFAMQPQFVEVFGDDAARLAQEFQRKFLAKTLYGYVESSRLSQTGTIVVSVCKDDLKKMEAKEGLAVKEGNTKGLEAEVVYRITVSPFGLRVACEVGREFAYCLDEVRAIGESLVNRTVSIKPMSLQGPTTSACAISYFDPRTNKWVDLGLSLLERGYAKILHWQLDAVTNAALDNKDTLSAAEAAARAAGKGCWKYLGVSDETKEANAEAMAAAELADSKVLRQGSILRGVVVDVPSSDSVVVKDVDGNEHRVWLASCHVPKFNTIAKRAELWGYEAREVLKALTMRKSVSVTIDFIRDSILPAAAGSKKAAGTDGPSDDEDYDGTNNSNNNNNNMGNEDAEDGEIEAEQTKQQGRLMGTVIVDKSDVSVNCIMIATGYCSIAIVSRYDDKRSCDFLKMQAISNLCDQHQIGVHAQLDKRDYGKLVVPKFVDVSSMQQKEIIAKAQQLAAQETAGFVDGVFTGGKMHVILRPTYRKLSNVISRAVDLVNNMQNKLGLASVAAKQTATVPAKGNAKQTQKADKASEVVFPKKQQQQQQQQAEQKQNFSQIKDSNFAPQTFITVLVGVTGAKVPSAKRNEPFGKEALTFLRENLLLTECNFMFTGAVEKMSGAMMATIKPASGNIGDVASALIKNGLAEKVGPIPLALASDSREMIIAIDNCVPQSYYSQLREIEDAAQAARIGLFALRDPAANARKVYQKAQSGRGMSALEIAYKYGSLLTKLDEREAARLTAGLDEADAQKLLAQEAVARCLGAYDDMTTCDIFGLNADINGTVTFRALNSEKPEITKKMLDEAGAAPVQRVFKNQIVAIMKDDGTYARGVVCDVKNDATTANQGADAKAAEQKVTIYLTDEGCMYDNGKKISIDCLYGPLPSKIAELPPSVVRAKLALMNTTCFASLDAAKKCGYSKARTDELRAEYLDEMIDCFTQKTLKIWMAGVHFDPATKENFLNILVYNKEDQDLIPVKPTDFDEEVQFEDAFLDFAQNSLNYCMVDSGFCKAEELDNLPTEATIYCEEFANAENAAIRKALGVWAAGK